MPEEAFRYRVGFLGCPVRTIPNWSEANLGRLKECGFNTVQLNVAWGSRPGAEAVNLEDVVELPPGRQGDLASATPMLGDQSPEHREWRREGLRRRIDLCRQLGLRTIFHFGAPYVGDQFIADAPANCLLDGRTGERCVLLLQQFAADFPGVDDILVYTYDQHAWLCSEFGPCPRCTGKPLHERAVPFLEELARTWQRVSPHGRLWWEPWELSGGQVLRCVERVAPEGFGLALHCNIAEVMATFTADRWLRNTVSLAAERGIPAIAEYWLGSASEELEPYTRIPYPLVTLRGLRSLAGVAGLAGVKEYYGLLPDTDDPNLGITALFFEDSRISEDEALNRLASHYGVVADALVEFWRLTSLAIDLFPWETSWLIRALGRSDPSHSMSAALVRGVPWHTPSWSSTRRSVFMVVDTADPPDPWMLEDLQLRCEMAAARIDEALRLGADIVTRAPDELAVSFPQSLLELREAQRRVLAYAYHARETNLSTVMRELRRQGSRVPKSVLAEMLRLLEDDRANQGHEEPVTAAIALLNHDVDGFLETSFQPDADEISKGYNSMTSR